MSFAPIIIGKARKMKVIILAILFAIFVSCSFAQSETKNKKDIPIELRVGNHAFDFPFPFGKIIQKSFNPNSF